MEMIRLILILIIVVLLVIAISLRIWSIFFHQKNISDMWL